MPWFVTAFGALCACVGFLILSFILFPSRAYAATTWTGGTFTYNGQTYPDNLVGVQVTFVSSPGDPGPYMGLSGGNIMWYPARYYLIGGHVDGTASSVPDTAEYWYSESLSSVGTGVSAWFLFVNNAQSTSPVAGFYYNGTYNNWYPTATSRTVTFAYGESLGDTSLYSDLPLLYQHDFIRYVVDNSDFRSRYVFPSSPTPVWTDITITVNSSGVLSWTIPSTNPSCRAWVQYSSDQSSWTNYQIYSPQNPGQTSTFAMTEPGYWRVNFIYSNSNTSYQVSNVIHYTETMVWTPASVNIVNGNELQISIPSTNNPCGLTILKKVGEAWITYMRVISMPGWVSYLLEASGLYQVIFTNPGDTVTTTYQTETVEAIVPVAEAPQYVGFYLRPDNLLLIQFSADAPKPDLVTLQYSVDGGLSWVTFSTTDYLMGSPSLTLDDLHYYPIGWYAYFENVPTAYYRILINNTTPVILGTIASSSGESLIVPDENTSGWISTTINWLTTFYNGMDPFMASLFGWMPSDLLSIFSTMVLISLLIGLVTIVRGH